LLDAYNQRLPLHYLPIDVVLASWKAVRGSCWRIILTQVHALVGTYELRSGTISTDCLAG